MQAEEKINEHQTEEINDLSDENIQPDTESSESLEIKKAEETEAEATADYDETTGDNVGSIDYRLLAEEDMKELSSIFPHLKGRSIHELENPLRYAALRDLGLSPKEAYLATGGAPSNYDNRSHLRSRVPSPAKRSADLLGSSELDAARELFSGLSDSEIQKLYKKVTK